MNFKTINNASAELGLPHTVLRKMLTMHELPGFYTGTRYYVNVDMLKEKLEQMSAKDMGISEGGE